MIGSHARIFAVTIVTNKSHNVIGTLEGQSLGLNRARYFSVDEFPLTEASSSSQRAQGNKGLSRP